MKKGLVICGPDVDHGPLALLSGSFEEKMAKAAELGCDGVELMVRDPALLDWRAIRRTLEDNGLEVSQIVTGELFGVDGLCLVTADEEMRRRSVARAHAVIDMAACLDAMVNIGRLRGRLAFLVNVPDPWGMAVELLREACAYAAVQGVRMTIEPINRFEADYVFTVEDGLRLIADLSLANVGLMLDLFHMNIEDASIEGGLRSAGELLWHVHIADSNRRYPGSGHLDFGSIFATLEDMGYQGYVSAELLPLPDPDTAARETMHFLHRHLS